MVRGVVVKKTIQFVIAATKSRPIHIGIERLDLKLGEINPTP
jgi:hypothetical protein